MSGGFPNFPLTSNWVTAKTQNVKLSENTSSLHQQLGNSTLFRNFGRVFDPDLTGYKFQKPRNHQVRVENANLKISTYKVSGKATKSLKNVQVPAIQTAAKDFGYRAQLLAKAAPPRCIRRNCRRRWAQPGHWGVQWIESLVAANDDKSADPSSL